MLVCYGTKQARRQLSDSCSSGPRYVRMASGAVFISRLIWFWMTLVVLVVCLYHVRRLTGYSARVQLQSAEPWIFIYNWPFVPFTCDVICSLNPFCKRQPVLRLARCKPCSVYHQHQRHTTPTFHVIWYYIGVFIRHRYCNKNCNDKSYFEKKIVFESIYITIIWNNPSYKVSLINNI